MLYNNDYKAPGVDVKIEQRNVERRSAETQFYPVYVGTGITSRTRSIKKTNLRADTSAFPKVTLRFDLIGNVNVDLFEKTKFTMGQVTVTLAAATEGNSFVTLEKDQGYTVDTNLQISGTDGTVAVVLNITNTDISANDVLYEINVTASNVDRDFDIQTIGVEDRFFSKDLFGPTILKENDAEFFNDIGIAAEIAFRMEVPRFMYLEVPRDYGENPTVADFKAAIEKIYFESDAYRIIPLTNDPEIIAALNTFIKGISNPLDRRETVGFVTFDASELNNMNEINELVQKVGGLSETLNNKRMVNVFGGRSADLRINNQVYVLPDYFISAAVATLDAVVGRVQPLSLQEINVFERIDGPRFRPREWDALAKKGVCIVYQDGPNKPAVIRHQLTTAQSALAEDQEYSVVKNFDVVTKKIRDRFKPYAGRNNIDAGYTERLDGTMATVIQEILEEGLARNLTVLTPWTQREGSDGRNLVNRLKLDPVFPANQLDVYLIV